MDVFVKSLLEDWNLSEFASNFENEGIDEYSFPLLDEETIRLLIPKAGPRLKFLKLFRTTHTAENKPDEIGSEKCDSKTEEKSKGAQEDGNLVKSSEAEEVKNLGKTTSTEELILKKIRIKELLERKLPEIYLKLVAGVPGSINITAKYKINRAVVDAYISNFDSQPTTQTKLLLAKKIVECFPVLKGLDGEGHEQWFTAGSDGSPARGFIAERFRNFRLRNLSTTERRELGIPKKKRETPDVRKRFSEDSSLTFLQRQQWLKENSEPKEEVILLMGQTFEGRRFQILENAGNVFESWPRLLNQHIIDAEFNLLYENKGNSFCADFGLLATSLILQAKHCGRLAAEQFANGLQLNFATIEPSNEKTCAALLLLPLMLPEGGFKKKGTKTRKIKPTGAQSQDNFIQFLPVCSIFSQFISYIFLSQS
ncbi:uncharacterized protein LOC129219219 [Uloborus diversus]|uniref:uncharacterized protein LOC129219219 n=1 Tax=Uloborus diversus TaxID=327109 RepID=UPI0024095B46|nr:uncharacterized protein LOC129219219 [Uloborus diversus]